MIEIKNDSQRDEVMLWVSDLYKDVYGIRPRGYNWDAFSNKELEDFVNALAEESDRQEEELADFDRQAIESVMSLGVDRLTALKWLDDADKHYMFNDDEFYFSDIDKFGWVAKHK